LRSFYSLSENVEESSKVEQSGLKRSAVHMTPCSGGYEVLGNDL